MMRLIGVPKIDWMRKRYIFWTISAAFVLFGMSSMIWQGSDIWGIEFSSGTQALVRLKNDAVVDGKLPTDRLVEDQFKRAASSLGYTKLVDTVKVERIIDPNQVRDFFRDYDRDGDGVITAAEWTGNAEFFAMLDQQTGGEGRLTREKLAKALPASSYQVSTTETEVSHMSDAATEAFGAALANRVRSDFELTRGGVVQQMNVTLADDGLTMITPAMLRRANPAVQDELLDHEGGVMLVVRNVDPALTRVELTQRLRDMRLQPDFAALGLRQTEVIGLTPAGGETYSSFAVLVKPADALSAENPAAWQVFAQQEQEVLAAALQREEAMVATNFDAAIAGETAQLAIIAILLSWAAIIAYLWLRFGSARWGLAAVVCLMHDALIMVGLVAISGWLKAHVPALAGLLLIDSFKIDLAMVAAILTVIGYSVNDTIVVFDRIRENRGRLTGVSEQIINNSINQMLGRTLLTSFTTLAVVFLMYVMGGSGIHAFSFALLTGILFGTYSSIAVASPLLLGLRRAIIRKVAQVETVAK